MSNIIGFPLRPWTDWGPTPRPTPAVSGPQHVHYGAERHHDRHDHAAALARARPLTLAAVERGGHQPRRRP